MEQFDRGVEDENCLIGYIGILNDVTPYGIEIPYSYTDSSRHITALAVTCLGSDCIQTAPGVGISHHEVLAAEYR